MTDHSKPTYANGKVCYLEIPAKDVKQAAAFYQRVFGWNIREDSSGHISFDDSAGEVSGMWVEGKAPATDPGITISIMVYDINATIELITQNGGIVKTYPAKNASEKLALFSDPAGNTFQLYQHRQ